MATYPRNRFTQYPNPLVPTARSFFWRQDGWNSDFKTECLRYSTVKERVFGECHNPFNNTYTAYDAGNSPGSFAIPGYRAQSTYNSAYERFVSRARGGDSAQLGVALGEFRSTARMMDGAAHRLLKTAKQLDFRYRKSLALRRRFRTFADYWLEWSFGWAPLFGDLYRGARRLSQEPPPIRAFGAATSNYSDTSGSGNPRHVRSFRYTVRVFGEVHVTNPSLALATDLGLTNPATVAWELVRFSFVVDWMTDMGSFLSGYTDFFGRTLYNAGWSRVQFGVSNQTWAIMTGKSKSVSLVSQRQTGIALPLPNLDIRKNIGKSLKRAANALALTTQIITRGGGRR